MSQYADATHLTGRLGYFKTSEEARGRGIDVRTAAGAVSVSGSYGRIDVRGVRGNLSIDAPNSEVAVSDALAEVIDVRTSYRDVALAAFTGAVRDKRGLFQEANGGGSNVDAGSRSWWQSAWPVTALAPAPSMPVPSAALAKRPKPLPRPWTPGLCSSNPTWPTFTWANGKG